MQLSDLDPCFDGTIPAMITTVSAEGQPNVSMLSHVVRVDDRHIALSNQFFSKTSSNLSAVPKATLMLLDGANGRQFRIGALFVRSETSGPIFETVDALLAATSAQVGMADVMRLRAVDIFLVKSLAQVPALGSWTPPETRGQATPNLVQLAELTTRIGRIDRLGDIVDAVLDATLSGTPSEAVSVLLRDHERGVLTIAGSRGYDRSGIGAELGGTEGVAGLAAMHKRPIKIGDLSRVRRYGAAIQSLDRDENRTPTIPLPGLRGAQSQLAVPVLAQGQVEGVILAESAGRLAFSSADEAFLTLLGNIAGPAIALADLLSQEGDAAPETRGKAITGPPILVQHHEQDDSVFINDAYIIKGVAGRILVYLTETHLVSGRTEFSNREIRLAKDMRLPAFRDNLETRLLLLQRRLEERAAPIRIIRQGQGQLRLEVAGQVSVRRA